MALIQGGRIPPTTSSGGGLLEQASIKQLLETGPSGDGPEQDAEVQADDQAEAGQRGRQITRKQACAGSPMVHAGQPAPCCRRRFANAPRRTCCRADCAPLVKELRQAAPATPQDGPAPPCARAGAGSGFKDVTHTPAGLSQAAEPALACGLPAGDLNLKRPCRKPSASMPRPAAPSRWPAQHI